MNTPQPDSDHESSRVRQFHAVCLLLENEQTGAKVKSRHAQRNRGLDSVLPHGFLKGLTGLLCLVLAVSLLVTQLARRPADALVPDYRWSAHYDAADASDVEFVPDRNGLLLATRGNAIHELDVKSGYFKQHTSASTGGGLLSDDVAELQRGNGDRLFLLCEKDGQRGLVSSSTALTDWKSLIGLERFPGLKDGSPTGQITAVADVGGTLWFGTRESGIGVYAPSQHAWLAVYQATETGLLDNRVNDLLVAPDGHVWVATATGLNRISPQDSRWEQFRAPDNLVGANVRRLSWKDGRLLYLTAGGGMGQFDGSKWETISGETHWGTRSDQDVAVVTPGSDPQHLWFVGMDGAAGRYDSRFRGWTEFPVKSGGRVPLSASVAVGRDGPQLWVGTSDGLQVLDVNSGAWTAGGLKSRPVVAVDAGSKAVAAMVRSASGTSPLAALVSAPDGAWRTAIGQGRAATGTSGILSVAFDESRQQLLTGSETGISLYDARIHDWIAPQKPQTGKLPTGSVVDLQLKGDEVLVLTSEGYVSTWDRKNDNWSMHLGGGRFPGGMADVNAITRSSDGRLWFGSSKHGVHTYEPTTRRWAAISSRLTGVSQLAADQNGIWCLASGHVHYIDAKQTVRELKIAPTNTVRLFASPNSEGAILLDPQGRVLHLTNTQSIQTVIGEPAKGLDLDTVSCLARDRDLIVLGGKTPYTYQITTRSWTPLKLGEIVQAVTALNQIWLRDQQGKLYSLSSTNPAPAEVPTGSVVAGLAVLDDQLLALGTTGGILRRRAGVAEWEVAKTAPAGPKPDFVLSPAVSVTAQGEDLLLAGGAKQELWRFSWLQQKWEQVLVAANRQLAGVGRLTPSGKKSYAFVPTTGQVFSIAPGTATAKLESVPPVSRLQSSGHVLTATGRHGGVQINQQDDWTTFLGDVKGSLATATLTDAAEFSDGVVLGSSKGAAWLSADLTTWKSIGGSVNVERFLKPHTGDYLWALSDRKQLFQIDRGLPDGNWQAITFPNPQATVSHVVISENKDSETGWVCLTDGTVHQVNGDIVTLWHQPTAAPEGPENMIGILPAAEGPLVAFRNGSLALFNETSRQWVRYPTPSVPGAVKIARDAGIAEVAVLGAEADQQSWWVLGTNGDLLMAPRAAAPKWRRAAADVSDISVGGAVLYAVSTAQRSVLQFTADGKSTELFHSPGGFQKPAGPLSAAAEVPRDKEPPLLVITDPARVEIYDPTSRQWKSQDLALSKLRPISGGLAGLTATGKIVVGEWKAEQLKFTPLLVDPKISALQMATSPTDNRVVAQLTDGRLVVLEGQQPLRQLRGPWLPKEAMNSKIVDLAVLGTRLFLTLDNGQLYVYDESEREWSSLKDLSGAPGLLAVQKNLLWIETLEAGRRRLYRLEEEQPGKFASLEVAANFDGWHVTPAGPLLELKTPQGPEHRLIDLEGKAQSLPPPSLGPVDTDVVGHFQVGGQVWLATNGELWNYHATTHLWSAGGLGAKAAVHSALLDRPLPLVLTSSGSLRLGNWEDKDHTRIKFEELAAGVTAFDADEKYIASCSNLEVAVRQAGNAPADAEVKHELQFADAGWKSATAQPVAAVGRGGELWVASDARDISSYRLNERTWQKHAPAPKQVQDLFFVDDKLHLISAKGDIAVLNDDGWQEIPDVARPKWSAGPTTYEVDKFGRVLIGKKDGIALAVKPVEPQLTAAPRRLHVDSRSVWIEFSDSSLWRLDLRNRRLGLVVPPPADKQLRTGLVAAGGAAFFVADREGQVSRLDEQNATIEAVTLPEGIQGRLVEAAEHENGLLISGPTQGVLLSSKPDVLVDGPALTNTKKASTAPAKNRLMTSNDWRINPAEEGRETRLAYRYDETWQELKIDSTSARFAFDIVTAGLESDQHIYTVSPAGICVYEREMEGIPKQFFPIERLGGGPATLTAWSVPGNGVIVRGNNGRCWKVTAADRELQSITQPKSSWTVNPSTKPVGLSVEIVAGTPVPVSLSAPGRFGFDRPRAVALFADQLYISTDDVLLVYSLTVPDLKVPVASHDVRHGELLVSVGRKRLLVQLEREGRRVTRSFDGSNWTNAPEQSFADELGIRKLRNRLVGQPLDFKFDLRADGKTSLVAGYRGRGLLHDTPLGAQCVTTDGNRVYLLTAHGLVIRNDKGEVETVQNADVNALAWQNLGGDAPGLLLKSRDGLVSKLTAGRVEKTTAKWDDAASLKTVKWQETEYRIDLLPTKTVAEFHAVKAERLVLNIGERGFLHDHVVDMIRAGESVWTLAPGRCERTSLAQTEPYSWQFKDTGTNPSLQMTELGPCIVFGDVFYLLTERDVPSKIQAGSKATLSSSVLLSGEAWRVTRTAQDEEIQFRNSSGQWTDARFDRRYGLNCDVPNGVATNDEYLVLGTQAGTFVISRSTAKDGIGLMELVPLPGLATSAQSKTGGGLELWTDPAGTIWGRPRDITEWQAFDAEKLVWSRGRELPGPAIIARNRLYTGSSSYWRRNGTNVELVEATLQGQEAISTLRANGQFDFNQIDAAFEAPEGVWTASRTGLRLIEPATGKLVAFSNPAESQTAKAEFRRLDDAWHLQYGAGGPRFRLQETAWIPQKAEPNPFDINRILADSKALRVSRAEGTIRFAIKPGLGSDGLQSCTLVPEEGRFDFQLARDAVANDELIHVSTAVGVSTWRLGKDGPEFVSLRSDLTGLEVPGVDGQIACINRSGKTEEYRDATWQPVAIDAEKRSILAATSRWICRSTPEKAVIFVNQAKNRPIELDFDARGDFAYRHPVWMQTQDDGSCWTATQHLIVRNQPNAAGIWIPQEYWKPSELRRDAQEVRSFAVLEGIPYVDLDGSLYQYDPQTGWKELDDVEDFRRKRNRLWSDKQWAWQRTDQGVVVQHKASSGEAATLEWDQEEGRFDWDQATDAAVSGESIWLATKPGVQHILKSGSTTTLQYKFPVSAQDAFFVDMSNGALCVAAAGKDTANNRYATYDAASGADLTQVIPKNTAELVFNSIYHDGIWTFRRSAMPPILWHGHGTDLANGRFQHDDFHSLTWIGETVWLPTPVTLLQYRKAAQGFVFAKSFPLPEGQRRIEALSTNKEELQCLADDNSLVSLNVANNQWNPVPNESKVSSRTLIDTPFWTWTRDTKRDVSVRIKPSNDAVLKPILTSGGRFLFDNMSTCLSDESTIWFAGEGGIVSQNSVDGQFKRWYRTGLGKSGAQPLGQIIRLGRFGKEGRSISSGATKAIRDSASLYARNDLGRVWKYNSKGTGTWNEVDTDPWQGASGDCLIRSGVVDVLPGEKGRVKLCYAGSKASSGSVMNKGRLNADVIHASGWHENRTWLATDAGLVECDTADFAFRNVSSRSANQPAGALSTCRDIFVHPKDQRLYAATHDDQVYVHQSAGGWRHFPKAKVDAAFKEQAGAASDNEFWIWSRWGDDVNVRLKRAGPALTQWPLFVDGRFSFDVVRSIVIQKDHIVAATAAGLVQFRTADMQIEQLDRTALDADTGQLVSLGDVEQMLRTSRVVGLNQNFRFEQRENKWIRTLRTHLPDDWVFVDGAYHWQVAPREDASEAGSLHLELSDPGGRIRGRYDVLPGVPETQLRRMIAADGKLWIILNRGMYAVTPR